MPKTKDAFALKDFYYEICCHTDGITIPIFEYRFADSEETGIIHSDALVEDTLLWWLDGCKKGGKIKTVDKILPELEQAKKILPIIEARINKSQDMEEKIERHIVRLQKYVQQIFNQILTDGLKEELKAIGLRAKQLIDKYDYLLTILKRYGEILIKDWKEYDSAFQRECRKEFGNRLRQARIEKKLAPADVAKKLSLSRVGYGYYELGQRDIPMPTIYRLAEMLDVSTDWLFGLKK